MAETYAGIPQASRLTTVQDDFGFPEDCDVMFIPFTSQSKTAGRRERMIIWYDGAPAALFNNAPLGTLLVDTSTPALHAKTAAAGTGTWKSETLS